ncbi:MAG: AAA family ATPase [Bacteroidales bacterium]|nr:AAA family ATPase [Candidatus Sodaliphilus aphodohippi]
MSETLHYDNLASSAMYQAMCIARDNGHEFITPTHLLSAIADLGLLDTAFADDEQTSVEATDQLQESLDKDLDEMSTVDKSDPHVPAPTVQFVRVLETVARNMLAAERDSIDIPMLVHAILQLEDSWPAHYLKLAITDSEGDFMRRLVEACNRENAAAESGNDENRQPQPERWKSYVTCISDNLEGHNPLIGREPELERTMQVLCRKEKNNPLHLGEPGVGKTAIVYGLAQRIADGRVPERLKGFRIYSLELGSLLAGTQMRGDFENRIKFIMEGAAADGKAIIYIDEMHNIVGAGQTGEGSMDASNMLKPYLEKGNLRFIGATTYEEFNKRLAGSKGLMRRFQTIDIAEPTVDEAIKIVRALKDNFEQFHSVKYDDDALVMAVKASARHIRDRFLPDKAIDLIDEAGAYVQMHPKLPPVVDKALIAQVLARVARVANLDDDEQTEARLMTLEQRMLANIYGQDGAVRSVVESVLMSKAGLLDESKPLASLLFVGPTGVGKTELARVLAREMGVELIRFDMSEFAEKHTVAKLIGSPAGYVGYDDGGQLTDAVRRSPDCVLLLDEIEKAHTDIFDILLQVMDYGVLTDSKGRKAFFRNVVLIMTSNAGAQYARQAALGFASTVTAGDAMLRQVKKTFKPEFINRLSGTVVFNDMDRKMARMILDKKLRELSSLLLARRVKLKLDDAAIEWLVDKGYSLTYGAREMDRIIHTNLKTMLMREILFGKLTAGGTATVGADASGLTMKVRPSRAKKS